MILPLKRTHDQDLIGKARNRFREKFDGRGEPQVAMAPGRVNLIGEHTDYNDGFVLPMAIDRHVAVAFAPNGLPTLRAHSTDYETFEELPLVQIAPPGGSAWFDYIAGVFWALTADGYELPGLDLVVAGNIPIGAGLASSAALELATARAVAATAAISWEPLSMARMAQRAENEYVGVSCGIMDQLVSAASKKGCALLLDCRSLHYSPVPLPPDAVVVVMDTGTRRSLADGAYNERRRNCESAVRTLQKYDASIRALRDASPDALERREKAMDSVTFMRAQHVVSENARTVEMAEALEVRDLERAGLLMNESHWSLRDAYQVSSPELDLLSRLARMHPACWGARLTGAGFGGCGVALVRANQSAEFAAEVVAAYRAEAGLPGALYVCHPVEGVRIA